jgi:hypothetical protein
MTGRHRRRKESKTERTHAFDSAPEKGKSKLNGGLTFWRIFAVIVTARLVAARYSNIQGVIVS